MSDDDRGFTLLEVLAALVVLGLLTATITQGIRFGLRARDMASRIASDTARFETTSRVLRNLIARASPGDSSGREAVFTGTPHTLLFVTKLPEGFGSAAKSEAEISLGVDGGHSLVLRWRPHYRRWIVEQPAPATEQLLNGVQRLDLLFWRAEPGAGWVSDWSSPDPPRLVRFRILFPAGDIRHWPDIVAAPMRQFPAP
jgi:general secretion pathway protein J